MICTNPIAYFVLGEEDKCDRVNVHICVCVLRVYERRKLEMSLRGSISAE